MTPTHRRTKAKERRKVCPERCPICGSQEIATTGHEEALLDKTFVALVEYRCEACRKAFYARYDYRATFWTEKEAKP